MSPSSSIDFVTSYRIFFRYLITDKNRFTPRYQQLNWVIHFKCASTSHAEKSEKLKQITFCLFQAQRRHRLQLSSGLAKIKMTNPAKTSELKSFYVIYAWRVQQLHNNISRREKQPSTSGRHAVQIERTRRCILGVAPEPWDFRLFHLVRFVSR